MSETEWRSVPLATAVDQITRPVDVATLDVVPFAGVRWYAEGVYHRADEVAASVKTKRLNRLTSGDITYNRMWATKASFGVVGSEADGCLVTNDFPIFSARPELLPDYMRLVFQTTRFQSRAADLATGTTERRRLKEDAFASIVIDLPPIREQRRIVDLIGAIEADRDHVRVEAESLTTLLASVHLQLDQAAEWRQLREFADDDGIQIGPFGSQLHARDYVNQGLPVVMPQDMVDGTISDVRIKRVTSGFARRLARHVLEEGDILFARRGDLTKRAWVGPDHAGGLCGTGSIRFRPRNQALGAALFEALSTERCSAWLLEHAVGTTMPNLNTQIISALPVPDLNEDAGRRAAAAAAIRRQLSSLRHESTAAGELRTTLLNGLLSREVEIPEAYDVLLDTGVA